MKGLKIYFVISSIAISCASLFVISSITHTAKKEVQKDIANMGAYTLEMLSFYPSIDKEKKEPGYFTLKDLQAIKREFNEIRNVGGMVSCNKKGKPGTGGISSHAVRIIGKKYPSLFEGWSGIFGGFLWGTSPELKKILNLGIKDGRFINNMDLKLKRNVCVLGNYIYNQVGGKEIIGKKLEIREAISPTEVHHYTFIVIGGLNRRVPLGVLYSDMLTGGRYLMEHEVNLGVFVPITTLQEKKKTTSLGLGHIFFQVSSDRTKERIEELIEKITIWCKNNYGNDKEFYIGYATRLLDELQSQTKQASTFIGIIGAVSILASIINILSMMLLSVTNRTSEIGVRRAFGARKKDIFIQFITEGLIITAVGGIAGIILGITGVQLLGWYTSWEMVTPISGVFLALGTVFIIGIIGSLYPALRAANIPPAQAVKYE